MTKAFRLTISCIALATSLSVATTFSSGSSSPAAAAPGDGITAYISPPFVQGPPSGINATIENFDSSGFCSSLGLRDVGTFSGSCTQFAGGIGDHKFGGANTTTDQPTFGGTASPFVSPPSSGLTLTFPTDTSARYVGFWWSAGSAGNTVEFYSNVGGSDVLVATFTSTPINQLLNTSGNLEPSVLPPNPYPGTQVVTALDGSTYLKGYYFGRPKDHSSLTPGAMPFTNINDNIYSHAYLNVYASGAITFSKVVFIGGGFEMDNVAVSYVLRTPSPELVLLQSVLGKSVEFRANGGSGSMAAQTSDTATTLTQNTFTRDGHTFAGWSLSPTGPVDYLDGAEYAFGADITLHAQWAPDSAEPDPPEPTGPTVLFAGDSALPETR